MILVDPRVGSGDLLDGIKARVNGNAQLMQLSSADVCWMGNGPNGDVAVGLERKQIADMMASIRSDRYAGLQLKRMSSEYDVVYLLIEGLYRPDEKGILNTYWKGTWGPLNLANKAQIRRGAQRYFQYSELDKHLCSLENQKNVIVIRSTCRVETIWQIVNRYQWWQKSWGEHHSTEAIKFQDEVTFTNITSCRRFAKDLPGVGWEKSRLIAKYFGTIEDAVTAEEWEWSEIEGIGPKLAQKIYQYLRSRK